MIKLQSNNISEKISIVIPCYNSQDTIENVVNEYINVLRKNSINNYEFVLINDASKDNTWNVLQKIAKNHPNTTVISLSKNFGQHNAIMAGFNYVTGDYVVTSEDDGQTQLNIINQMIQKLQVGYDVVMANQTQQYKPSLFRNIGTKFSDFTSNIFLDNPENLPLSIFFMAKKYVIDEMIKYKNPYPFITGLVLRTTHKIAVINVEHLKRKSGQSGYSFKKLLKLWINEFTSFSVKPLEFSAYIGIISAIIGFTFGIYVIIRRIFFHNILAGWSSLVAIILFMTGIILFVLGLTGEYIGRIYICINQSPQYVIKDVVLASEKKNE